MHIEELWTAGLSACFAEDFDSVRRLYQRDEGFAEMCRDFVEIYCLTKADGETGAHVRECLNGLKDEIQVHFANSRVARQTGGEPRT